MECARALQSVVYACSCRLNYCRHADFETYCLLRVCEVFLSRRGTYEDPETILGCEWMVFVKVQRQKLHGCDPESTDVM